MLNFSWVKLLNEKLLIFFKENSKKANIIYDLTECTIKGKYFREKLKTKESSSFIRKTVTLGDLKKAKLSNTNKKRKSSGALQNISSACDSEEDSQELHLNFLIDIDHPYQKKCLIKGSHIFETLDFFKKIKVLVD